jgi:hypothetical protein
VVRAVIDTHPFFISLSTKREIYYLQFAIRLLIYIIYGARTIIAIIICDVRRRIRNLFKTFAVVLYISSSRCCYRLYERSFSIMHQISTRNKTIQHFFGQIKYVLWLNLTSNIHLFSVGLLHRPITN